MAIESTVTNTVGHGSAPMRNATYILEAVMIIRPMMPTASPLIVSGDFFSSMAGDSIRRTELSST